MKVFLRLNLQSTMDKRLESGQGEVGVVAMTKKVVTFENDD